MTTTVARGNRGHHAPAGTCPLTLFDGLPHLGLPSLLAVLVPDLGFGHLERLGQAVLLPEKIRHTEHEEQEPEADPDPVGRALDPQHHIVRRGVRQLVEHRDLIVEQHEDHDEDQQILAICFESVTSA